jgi:hypothetical protein
MAKLNDTSAITAASIGNDELLRFIDQINEIRRRSGNRFRLRPYRVSKDVLGMEEHYAIPRPLNSKTASEGYSA